MSKIKTVIFDLDGVLIDAKEWHFEALNRALGLFGMEISRYDHLVTYDGLPTKKKLEMLTRERALPVELHDFINDLKQLYTMEMISTRCRPQFIHQFALSHLARDGYHLAVCSNSIRESVEMMLKRADLLRYIKFFLSNQDISAPKPDPEMYLKSFKKLEINPQQCLIIEDNENGLRAARDSGAHVLQVASVSEVNYNNIAKRIAEIEGN